MIDLPLLQSISRAANDLRLKTSAPQFLQRDQFVIQMSHQTATDLDIVGGTLLGVPVELVAGIPPGKLRLLEERSQKYVDVKLS